MYNGLASRFKLQTRDYERIDPAVQVLFWVLGRSPLSGSACAVSCQQEDKARSTGTRRYDRWEGSIGRRRG